MHLPLLLFRLPLINERQQTHTHYNSYSYVDPDRVLLLCLAGLDNTQHFFLPNKWCCIKKNREENLKIYVSITVLESHMLTCCALVLREIYTSEEICSLVAAT